MYHQQKVSTGRWSMAFCRKPDEKENSRSIMPKIGAIFLILSMVMTALGRPDQTARAQTASGSITQTTAGDFGAVCASLSEVSISDAGGGEVRLRASLEDYFDGNAVDAGRWVVGNVYSWYTVPPTVSNGVLTLDSAYLRSQMNMQSLPVRFFEARALQRAGANNAGWPDLGFYRALPPLDPNAVTSDTAMRLFISRDTNTTYVRGRDGDGSAPLYDVDIPTLNLQQYHVFRVEWYTDRTDFFVDGVFQATMPGVSTLNTYAFLYHQSPTTQGSSPMQVDWVRAGAYPSTGTYTSCVLDAGGSALWQGFNSQIDLPAGTSMALQTRTSSDGMAWSDWSPTVDGQISSPAGRFLQYQLTLNTANPLVSPELREITFNYELLPVNTPEATSTFTPLPTSTATLEPSPTLTLQPTDTPAPTPTFTASPLPSPTASPSPLPTFTATSPLPTSTSTPTFTATLPPPTSTSTPTPTPQNSGVTDDFNRPDSTNLGASWTERVGDWQIVSGTLRNASVGGDAVVTYTGTYSNVQASADARFASNAGTISLGVRLGAFSGGVPNSGYVAELFSSGLVILWRIDNWTQLGSYQIAGYQPSQAITFALSASGSIVRVDVNGITRITATNTAFTSGAVGLWSYASTAVNQHILDNFNLVDFSQTTPTATPVVQPTSTSTSTPTQTPLPTATATPASGSSGSVVHDTVSDFAQVCAALSNVTVSDARGGEVRLAAPVEDYFNGNTVDTAQWVAGNVYTWYTVPPSVGNGVLTLDSAYLRSQANLQSLPVRFFEARALQRATTANAGWPDLGFYRALPPLDPNSVTDDSAIRLFVSRDTNTTYVRARDGGASAPLIDIDIPTIDLRSYHLFRIEWTATESRFFVDGVLQATIPGVSTFNTWVFLYNQTPQTSGGSPMQVDWVRAGAYPSGGSYTSCIQDAGSTVPWQSVASTADLPAGTGLNIETRTSDDGVSWSPWAQTSGNTIVSPAGRYLQYRLNLSSGNVLLSPEVQRIVLTYALPSGGATATATSVPTATSLPSSTPTPLPSATFTASPTAIVASPTFTATPLPSATPTATATATRTSTPLPSATPTATATATPTRTPTLTPSATLTPTVLPDLIFADGFEGGNLLAWSSSVTGGGDLSASTAAALRGSYGLRALINDNTAIYVVDDTPAAEARYRARFYFDPNSISMTSGNAHYIFYGYSGTLVTARIEFRRYSGAYQVRAQTRNNGSTFLTTSYVTISDAPHSLEIDWRASTAAGASNGWLTFWVDGVQVGSITGVDNDTRRIDSVRLGAVDGIDSGTRGTEFFDSFESRRLNYIGP